MADGQRTADRPQARVRSRSRSPARGDETGPSRDRGYDVRNPQPAAIRGGVGIRGAGRNDGRDGRGNGGHGNLRSNYQPRQGGGAFNGRARGGWGPQHQNHLGRGSVRGSIYIRGDSGRSRYGVRGGGYGVRGGRGGKLQEDPEGHLPLPVLPSSLIIADDAVMIDHDSALHDRPAGKLGIRTTVTTNHYEICSLPRGLIYSYDVTVMTSRGSQEKRELTEKVLPRVWQIESLRDIADRIFKPGNGAIWDGISIIYSIKPLELAGDPALFTVEDQRGLTWDICIKRRKDLDIDDLLDYAKSGTRLLQHAGAVSNNVEAHRCMVFLNALLRHMPAKKFKSGTGAKSTTFFDPKNTRLRQGLTVNSQLQAWSGVYQSAAIRFGRLTVNVDIATQLFIAPGCNFVDFAASLINQKYGNTRPEDVTRWYVNNCRGDTKLWNKVVGSKLKKHVGFRTKHLPANSENDPDNEKFTKYVYGFTFSGACEFRFPRRKVTILPNGGTHETVVESTVAEYFKEVYNIELQYPRLPLVEPVGKKGTVIPMELCYVHQAERFRGELDGHLTAEFLKYATSAPQFRQAKISRNIGRLGWHENPDLKAFRVTVNPKPITREARILPPPSLLYARNHRVTPTGGRWNLRSVAFTKPCAIRQWCVVWFPRPTQGKPPQPSPAVQHFIHQLPTALRQHGFQVGGCAHIESRDIQSNKRVAIQQAGATTAKKTGVWPNIVVIILPSRDTGLYGDVKRACEIELGVACQCISAETLEEQKSMGAYMSNIALKMCAKLGGISNSFEEPFFDKNRCMVYGADISKGRGTQDEDVTYTAVVGSYDRSCQQYSAITGCQQDEDGIIKDFPAMVKEQVGRYMTKNEGMLPERILYFRSGLSEERYEEVLDKELESLQKYNKQAQITVIICIKRHHTRLFPADLQNKDRLGNVLPGTVVENRPDGKDIFMVPHAGLQGTVRPTHYISVYDDNNLTADEFQRICNNLSYAYARSTTSVSMIPAVYYAGLASARASNHQNLDEDAKGDPATGVNTVRPGNTASTTSQATVVAQTSLKQVTQKYRMWFQ